MTTNWLSLAWAKVAGFFTRPQVFVMSVRAGALMENFFVSAVASILAIRLYLQITGFPQLSAGSLHIAHTLWGGLLMLIALVILLAFLDQRARGTAAVLGGIGFGAFIDELGKFITGDNDYFFQPAVALIYIVFILIFFALRYLGKRRAISSEECLANVFDIAKQGSLTGLDSEERDYSMNLLDKCPAGPVRGNLKEILQSIQDAPPRTARPIARFHKAMDTFYTWAAPRWWFGAIIIGFFAFTAVTSLYTTVAVAKWSLGSILWVTTGAVILAALVWLRRATVRFIGLVVPVSAIIISILVSWIAIDNLKGMPVSIVDWAKFVFPSISAILISQGILLLPRSRFQAYLMFRRAMFISIFFTQVLAFYDQQILAMLGLILNILILVALRYLITHESMKEQRRLTY
jgi:hypothetical protein